VLRWIKNKLDSLLLFPQEDPAPKLPPPTKSLDQKLNYIKSQFRESPDVSTRELRIGPGGKTRAALFFVEGMVDKEALGIRVIRPLVQEELYKNIEDTPLSYVEAIAKHLLLSVEVKTEKKMHEIVECVLQGDTALFIDGCEDALILGHRKLQTRAIEEPDSERTTQGPRAGFVEDVRINTALLRQTISSPNLVLEMTTVGVQTKTKICIAYLKDIVRPEIVAEVKRRLNSFKIDALITSGMLTELISDAPHSIFPVVAYSERPDKVASKILCGRVAIIVDGTPFVLTVPHLFIENFQVPSDYASPWVFQSFVRLLRLFSFLVSIFTVPFYVGITSFHQELLPNKLAMTIAAARMAVPFSAIVEALVLAFFFEILREASLRIPGVAGGAVNIVGALVVGEAAVNAGIVGAPMVIAISLSAIANFVVTPLTESATLLRYVFLLLVGFMGFYGLAYGVIVTTLYLTSLYSFGVPYLSPLSPVIPDQLGDTVIRTPIWNRVFRPRQFAKDRKRAEFRLTHQKQNTKDENH